MKILSIKYKTDYNFIEKNYSSADLFSVVFKHNKFISKIAMVLVHQYNDNYPYYIKNQISNYQYNIAESMEENYGCYDFDFMAQLKNPNSWERQEYERIRPVIYNFIKENI